MPTFAVKILILSHNKKMAKKFLQTFSLLLVTLAMFTGLTSCSSDEPDSQSIVGTWTLSEVEENVNEITTVNMTLTFKSDHTGSIVEVWNTESRASSNERLSMNFSWSSTTDSDGNDILRISHVEGDKSTQLFPGSTNTVLWTLQYVQTGKILNVYSDYGNVWVFKKK